MLSVTDPATPTPLAPAPEVASALKSLTLSLAVVISASRVNPTALTIAPPRIEASLTITGRLTATAAPMPVEVVGAGASATAPTSRRFGARRARRRVPVAKLMPDLALGVAAFLSAVRPRPGDRIADRRRVGREGDCAARSEVAVAHGGGPGMRDR